MTDALQISMWTNGLQFLREVLWKDGQWLSFENHVFALRPDSTDDVSDTMNPETCNFYHKPSKTMVNWYKHPGRGMELSRNLDNQDIGLIILDCLKSLW